MAPIATTVIYGTGGGRSPFAIMFHHLAPVVEVGLTAAFFVSPWSPLAAEWRSRIALFFSAALAFLNALIPRIGLVDQELALGVGSAFGLAFAISRIRTAEDHRSPGGWFCAVIHGILILEASRGFHV